MNKLPNHRRSPLVSTLIFIVGLTAGLLLIALLQLDIGAYKVELANHLERTLNKPVRLGDASLSFHGGIALDFRNLSIGDDNSFSLHVPQLTSTLNPFALLRGEIDIEQVVLDYPSLKLTLPQGQGGSDLDLTRLGLKTLQVRKGSLLISYPGTAGKPLRVENFNLVIHGLGKGLVSQAATTATLFQNNRNADLKAFIELTRSHQNQPWRQGRLRGNLSLNHLRSRIFGHWESEQLPQRFDLALGFEGVPSERVKLTADLRDSLSSKSLISLSSHWRSQDAEDSFSNIKLGLVGIPFSGKLRLDRHQQEAVLRGHIELQETRLSTLLAANPEHPLKSLTGRIVQLTADFSGPLRATMENPFSPLQRAQLRLDRLSYSKGALALKEGRVEIKFLNGRLSQVTGEGRLNATSFELKGESGTLSTPAPEFNLDLNALTDLNELHRSAKAPFWKRQKLSGKVPLKLQLNGRFDDVEARMSADLDQSRLTLGKMLDKQVDQPLQLFLSARLKPNQIQLTEAGAQFDRARLNTHGDLRRKNGRWSGTLLLSDFETGRLQPYSPLFEFFRIAGLAKGRIELDKNPRMLLDMQNGSSRLARILGKLNQASGQILFDRRGIDFGTVKGKLGDSPVKISGAMKNWRNPLFALRMTGEEVRAQDLIFSNREMTLQNIDAHLLINRGGISFNAIDATLEKKTRVRVEGMMRGYHEPQIYLEASSDDADILDIINLFSGPRAEQTNSGSGNKTSLELLARVKKGRLGSFYFENAVGRIHDRNEVFTLYPFDFQIGKGRASGRVEFDRTRDYLLKISGAASNCDADRVYEMLFEEKGIFKGTLSGNFYLEGEEVGERFWKTAKGGGHLRIHKGVMRELKGFAEIFSLLNVSQLFKFRLPDMNKEGLPFSLLETSGRMTDGILSYDDFRITSPAINISAVGKIDSLNKTVDSTVGIKPLRTVDIILSRVPLFGWVLTGEEEALITALFTLKGKLADPKVSAAPASSVAKTALGIIGRALTLPLRVIQKTNELLTTPPRPEAKPTEPEPSAPDAK